MMESWTEYFSKCLPCECANFTRITRNHRVSPETNSGEGGGRVVITKSNLHETNVQSGRQLNGEINLHYVSDGADESCVIESPSTPPHEFSTIRNGNVNSRPKIRTINDHKTSYENNNSYLTTVFIETAKRKQLRVVHLRAIDENEQENEDSYDNNTLQDDLQRNNNSSSSSEDEDEYWFSKWSRRPRLKKFVDVQQRKAMPPPPEQIPIPVPPDNTMSVSTENEALQVGQQEWNPRLNPNDDDDDDDNDKYDGEEEDSVDGSPKKPVTSSSPTSDPVESSEHCLENGYSPGFTNLAFQPDEDDNLETIHPIHTFLNDFPQDIDTSKYSSTASLKTPEVEEKSIPTQESSVNDIIDDTSSLKPLLFFIHGIAGSSETFASQIDYFHKLGYEIVALDLLGHGLSSTPPHAKLYHFESLVQDVVTVFDHFVQKQDDLDDRQVVIIGHGYGACLATVLTRIRPKNARILISISGGGPTPMVASYWCQASWLSFPCNFLPRRKKQGRFDNPDLRHILPYNVHENIMKGQIWLDGDPAFHRRITIPTLLVYGMRDKVVNLVEVCEMERTIPRAFLEIINTAGHMVMWDEAKKLNRMMRKFIESQWS